MAYLNDFDISKYHLYSNIKLEERDYMTTLSMLCGIPYKVLPGVKEDGCLLKDSYSLWVTNNCKREEYALTNVCMYLGAWRRNYLKDVGIPVDLLFKNGRFGPIGTEKTSFPEFADKIQSPLPISWKEVVCEIEKYKQEYDSKQSKITLPAPEILERE